MSAPRDDATVHELVWDLVAHLPKGRSHPRSISQLARDLGVSPRMVQALAAEAIDAGYLIGSTCTGEHGLFICGDVKDVEVGTAHIVARARSMYARVGKLRRLAVEKFGPEQEALFALEEVS